MSGLWLIGSPGTITPSAVSDEGRWLVPDTVRRSLARSVSSSRELRAASRVLPALLRPFPVARDETPSVGLRSLFAVWAGSHSEPGFRVPTLIRPRRFARPRRLLLRQLRGSISPHYHVQGSTFRGFASREAGNASSTFRALPSLASVPLPPVSRRRHVTAPRPQGFAPRGNPSSRKW